MRWDHFSGNRRKHTKPETPLDRGNALTRAQEEMRETDPRPAEEIVREQRDTEWK
jgi:hypothetical protein